MFRAIAKQPFNECVASSSRHSAHHETETTGRFDFHKTADRRMTIRLSYIWNSETLMADQQIRFTTLQTKTFTTL